MQKIDKNQLTKIPHEPKRPKIFEPLEFPKSNISMWSNISVEVSLFGLMAHQPLMVI